MSQQTIPDDQLICFSTYPACPPLPTLEKAQTTQSSTPIIPQTPTIRTGGSSNMIIPLLFLFIFLFIFIDINF